MVTIQKSGEVGRLGRRWLRHSKVPPMEPVVPVQANAPTGKSRQAQSHNELKEFSHHVFPFWKSTSRRGLETCLFSIWSTAQEHPMSDAVEPFIIPDWLTDIR